MEEINLKVFASASPENKITEYGTAGNNDPIYPEKVSDIQNTTYWDGGLQAALTPDRWYYSEDENGFKKIITYVIRALQQNGLPQWMAERQYIKGSFTGYISDGYQKIYMNRTGNNSTTTPDKDKVNWLDIAKYNLQGAIGVPDTDLNTYTEVGYYWLPEGHYDNSPYLPSTEFFFLTVKRNGLDGSLVLQETTSISGVNNYARYSIDGGVNWTVWKSSSPIPTGTIVAYGSTTAPEGWINCDGALISRETYAGLFAVIGTTYGEGDGSTTFQVPDLRKRVAEGCTFDGTSPIGKQYEAGIQDHKHYLINESRFDSYGGVAGGTMGNSSNSMGNNDYWLCGTNQAQTDSGSYPANRYLSSEASKTNVENTVYGKSDTVQMASTVVNYIIKR